MLAALAHIALTRAYAKADASAVMPFDYMRLPFVAVIAFLAFGEVPDLWTWIGAGVIAASAIYIVQREASIARAAERERRRTLRRTRGVAAVAPRAR